MRPALAPLRQCTGATVLFRCAIRSEQGHLMLGRIVLGWLGPQSRIGRSLIAKSAAGAARIRTWLFPVAALVGYGRLLTWGLLRTGFVVAFVLIIFGLLMSDPGGDYILSFALDATWRRWSGLVMWVAAWVLTGWFWGYISLISAVRMPAADQLKPGRQEYFIWWLKRWLATIIAITGGLAIAGGFLWIAHSAPLQDGKAADALMLAAVAVLVMTVVVIAVANRVAALIGRSWQRAPNPAGVVILWRWIIFVGGLTVLICFLAQSISDPVGTSNRWGGAFNLLLIAAMAWIGLGTTLVLLGDTWGVPLVGLVVLWFVCVSAISNQHRLERTTRPVSPRNLETAFEAWRKHSPSSQHPLVLVATAGGGIRAAYWTATVLGQAHDEIEDFNQALFAISGVSGGSLGAVIYSALVAHGLDRCRARSRSYTACGQEALSQDLLGPTVVGYVFTDVLQSFVPTGVVRLNDRAHALEQAIAQGWRNAFSDDSKPFGETLDTLYGVRNAGPVPELLLNGTSVRTGTRVITASLATPDLTFPGAIDARAAFRIDPTLAEAVLNSARFPFVTPVAGVDDGAGADEIGDGGYFENFGAATAEDVLRWLRAHSDKDQRIIVVSISSDDTLPVTGPFWPSGATCKYDPPSPEPIGVLLPQAFAPVLALSNGRSAHGQLAAWRLKRATEDVAGDRFIPFRLTRSTGQQGLPLSWALSETGRRSIREELSHCPNKDALAALKAALNVRQTALNK